MLRNRPVLPVLLAAALTAALLAGCSGDDTRSADTTTTTAASAKELDLSKADFVDRTKEEAVQITATDNDFNPRFVEVSVGTTVTFVNKGRNKHDALAARKGAFPDILPEHFEPGHTVEITLTRPGDVPYYCTLHGTKAKGMVGAIRVVK